MARWRGKVQLNIGFCLVRYPSPWSSSMARVPTALKTHKLSNSQSHSQSDLTPKHTNSHLHKHTNSHSQGFWKKKKKTLTLTYIGGRGLLSAAALSLISLTVSALNRSVRLQRLSFPSPSLRSTVPSLSLSLSIVKHCRLELITTFCASDNKRL